MGFWDNDADRYDDRHERDNIRRAIREERRYGDRYGEDEDIGEFYIKMFLIIAFGGAIVIGGLYFGAGWLDNQFGLHITEWINSWMPDNLEIDNATKS